MRADVAVVSDDLVPLAERARHMRGFRVVLVALVALAWLALPGLRATDPVALAAVCGGYLLVAVGAEAVWRGAGGQALVLFSGMLIVDAAFLTWLGWAVEGGEWLRALALLHLVTASLLASFRTGVKLAFWYALLLLGVFHLREAGVLGEPVTLGGPEYREILAASVVALLAALVTASFAAVNERELRRRRYDLEALGKLALTLEATTESRAVAEALVAAVVDDFEFPRAVLLGTLKRDVLAGHGLDGLVLGSRLGESRLFDRVAEERRPVLVSDLDPELEPALAGLVPGARNLVLVTLHAERRAVGVLVCEHGLRRGGRIERRVTTMLTRYASQSAFALAGAWLFELVQRSAASDGLTGLANRRAFDDGLAGAAARALRTGEPLALVLLDVDHFKRLNDALGHVTGDGALRAVAAGLTGTARTGDLVARYGGEEFAVLLPGVGADEAVAAAERLRRAAAADGPADVTLSAGVAVLGPGAPDPLSLVQAADAALYAAKASGRNRTCADGSSDRPADLRPVDQGVEE